MSMFAGRRHSVTPHESTGIEVAFKDIGNCWFEPGHLKSRPKY